MDLKEIKKREVSALEELKPGVYDLKYHQDEIVQGKNGWEALKAYFRVVGQDHFFVTHTFTVAHDTSEKSVDIGLASLTKFSEVCGFEEIPDNSDDFQGCVVRANVLQTDDGFYEVDDVAGRGWKEAEQNHKTVKKEIETKEEPDSNIDDEDGDIPF